MVYYCNSQRQFDIMKILSTGELLTRKEILNCMDDPACDISEIRQILSILSTYSYGVQKEKINNVNHYYLKKQGLFFDKITKMTKEKNILSLTLNNHLIIQYDFLREKVSVDIKDQDLYILRPKTIDSFEKLILSKLIKYSKVTTPEWIFSYLDVFDLNNTVSDFERWNRNLPNQCPSGYIHFIQEHQLPTTTNTLTLFNWYKKISAPYIEIKLFYDTMANGYFTTLQLEQVVEYLYNNPKLLSNFYKSYIISAKNGEVVNWLDTARMLMSIIEHGDFQFDPNRTINYNHKNFSEFSKVSTAQRIQEKQQQINGLNNQEIDNYIIKIPQSVGDLIDEGRQQNNCVGSFYNSNIAQGQDLIYFIRKKENPNKSYITCRYSVACQRTVEHKYKNNKGEYKLENIRKIVDEQIAKLLSL